MAAIGTPLQATPERVIIPPNAFKWPFGTYPVTVFGSDGRFSTNVDPRSLVNSALANATNFLHVDIAAGNDGTAAIVTDPSDTSKPTQSIWKAISLGNAGGAPYRVFVKAGLYPRNYSAHSVAGTTFATQHCSIEGWGGRVVMPAADVHTFVQDGTQTNCYTTSRTGVTRVFDLLNTDANGNYRELTLVADAATCNSTAGSWAQVSSTLYIHRADGAVVTSTNTRAFIAMTPVRMNSTLDIDMYLCGLDLEGGNQGCVVSLEGRTRNLVAEDCTFKYAGSIASPADCVEISNMNGIAALFRCEASVSSKDGFNFHYNSANPGNTYVLTVDCVGRDNGRGTSTSNNGWTTHETVLGIDVNGVYTANYGANVHTIGTTQSWCVGTTSQNALGDVPLGGTIKSTGFRVNDSAKMWLDNTLAQGCFMALDAYDGSAAIYKRGHRSGGGVERARTANNALTTY